MRFLLLFLPLLLVPVVTAAPSQPRQSVVPIPDVPGPSLPPSGPEATASASVPPTPVIAITATPEPDLAPSGEAEPSPGAVVPASPPLDTPEGTLEGVRSRSANLASGLITLLLFLLAFLAFIFLAAAFRRDAPSSAEPNVYTSSAARSPAAATDTTPDPTEHVYTSKDDARDAGPPVPLPPPAAPLAAEYEDTGEGDAGVVGPVGVRGATPPPHDYVVGAGPAATRTDFDDLRTKFERDEIGDNSAVLGGAIGAGAMMRGVGEVGRSDAGGATAPMAPVPIVAAEEKAEKEGLPDRSGNVTFDSQERLMAGGDGSGQISDAALSLNAASIPEESADVPSLERDPIQVGRERDDTY